MYGVHSCHKPHKYLWKSSDMFFFSFLFTAPIPRWVRRSGKRSKNKRSYGPLFCNNSFCQHFSVTNNNDLMDLDFCFWSRICFFLSTSPLPKGGNNMWLNKLFIHAFSNRSQHICIYMYLTTYLVGWIPSIWSYIKSWHTWASPSVQ